MAELDGTTWSVTALTLGSTQMQLRDSRILSPQVFLLIVSVKTANWASLCISLLAKKLLNNRTTGLIVLAHVFVALLFCAVPCNS